MIAVNTTSRPWPPDIFGPLYNDYAKEELDSQSFHRRKRRHF